MPLAQNCLVRAEEDDEELVSENLIQEREDDPFCGQMSEANTESEAINLQIPTATSRNKQPC